MGKYIATGDHGISAGLIRRICTAARNYIERCKLINGNCNQMNESGAAGNINHHETKDVKININQIKIETTIHVTLDDKTEK